MLEHAPSTLLSNDTYYKQLYVDNTDLEIFYQSAKLGKRVERYIKSSNDYDQATKSDILFYVVYSVVAFELKSMIISVTEFKSIDMDKVDDGKIDAAAKIVFELYKELGGNNKVAKGSDLLERVQEKIGEM